MIDYDLMPEVVGIVGSRKWPARSIMSRAVTDFVKHLPRTATVVSGGATGVDKSAANAARNANLSVIEFLVDADEIERDGFRKAAFARNKRIVECVLSHQGIVVAFKNNLSTTKGTDNTIDTCDVLGVPCMIFTWTGKAWRTGFNTTLLSDPLFPYLWIADDRI